MDTLKIGTRGSELALFQARTVAALLEKHAGVRGELVIIKTSGDRLQDAPLTEAGGKRLFVKEIEDALLSGTVDLAVHSSKDMPAVQPDGLAIGAVLTREDPRDALVLPRARQKADPTTEMSVDDVRRAIGDAPRIGTSSVRRTAQLRKLFPNARFLPIRGNLDTRLRKLDEGQYDAIVLAAAGLRRLEQAARISAYLPIEASVPAPGQGIIAVELRATDGRAQQAVAPLDDAPASAALAAERAVVTRLGGGCQMPIGAYAAIDGDRLRLTAIVIALDGTRSVRAEAEGPRSDAQAIGERAATQLLEDGAGEILAEIERAQSSDEGRQP